MNNNIYGNNFLPNNFNNQVKYVSDYLRNVIGKNVQVHVSFSDSIEWRDSIFKGKLEDVGKDYLIIDNQNEKTIIWNIYIDYIIVK